MKQFSPRTDGSYLHGARQSAYIRKIKNLLASGLARPLHKKLDHHFALFLAGQAESGWRRKRSLARKDQNRNLRCPIIGYRDRTKAFSRVAARQGAGQDGFMVKRREVLKLVLGGIAAPFGVRVAGGVATLCAAQELPKQEAPKGFALGEPASFDPGMVTEAARTLSKRPFRPLQADIPGIFHDLSYEQYAAIRQRPGPRFGRPKIPVLRSNLCIADSSFRVRWKSVW